MPQQIPHDQHSDIDNNKKKLDVDIKTYDDYKKFQHNIRVAKAAIESYQLYLLRNLAETTVLQAIHAYMRGYNVSEKIITGTKIARVELINKRKGRVWIVSSYFNGSFDVAIARHEGTKRHLILPKQNRPNPHLRWYDKHDFGVRFSKGHWVRGLPKLRYISKVIEQTKNEFSAQFNLEMRVWLSKMLEVKFKLSY